jgi:hypothetical protein
MSAQILYFPIADRSAGTDITSLPFEIVCATPCGSDLCAGGHCSNSAAMMQEALKQLAVRATDTENEEGL